MKTAVAQQIQPMMYRQLLLLFLLSSLSRLSYAQINVDEVVFDKEIFNFGEVAFGTNKIKAVYIFTNNSEFDYQIKEITAACGCTVPNWPKNPIRPGMKGVITATFDPSNLAGEVDKSIEIFANYNVVMSKVLKIQGIIKEPVQGDIRDYVPGQIGYLRLSYEVLGFGTVLTTKSYTKELLMVNDYNLPLRINGVEKKPSWVDVSFGKMEIIPGDTVKILVTVHGDQINDYGLVNERLQLSTTDNYFSTKLVTLAMEVEPDFGKLKKKVLKMKPTVVLSQSAFDLGQIQKGGTKSQAFQITNTGKSTLKILKVKSDCGCTVLKGMKEAIEPGESITASLVFDSIFLGGKAEKEIILYTNDPTNHKVALKVIAFVVEN